MRIDRNHPGVSCARFSVRLLLTLAILSHVSCGEDRPTSRPASADNEEKLAVQSRPASEQASPDDEKPFVMDIPDWPTSRDWPASREASPDSQRALNKEIRSAVAQYLADHPEVSGTLRQALQELTAGADATSLGNWSLSGSERGRLYYEAYWIGNECHYFVIDLSATDSGVHVAGVSRMRLRMSPR